MLTDRTEISFSTQNQDEYILGWLQVRAHGVLMASANAEVRHG